ncbi:MAG: hypothetical protein EXS51_03560 [Candidatus Taylorbacteria bacterium]|nr:hypothetical protein [Candidatus Taylorbacteria bacterium]
MDGFETISESALSKEREKGIPVPIYNLSDQFTVDQLKNEYAQWASHYGGDAELTAINVERTAALRKLGKETGLGNTLAIGAREGLQWALNQTPREVGRAFDAHGIAGKQDAVAELDALLTKGIQSGRTFYTMNFIDDPQALALGAEHPFIEGGFIVVSGFEEKLADAGIKHVVVGEEYNRVLDILRKRYSSVRFIPWHEAPATLTALANEKGHTTFPLVTITEENRPHYSIPSRTYRTGSSMDIPAPTDAKLNDDVW